MDTPYVALPDDDESPIALLQDSKDYLADNVDGWAPSDAALEVRSLAADADEGATLYALLRERATDWFRDFAQDFLRVAPLEAIPASTITTWTARAAPGPSGQEITAGTQIILASPAGPQAFEVVVPAVIAGGATTATAVSVQALNPGADGNGSDGPVQFDDRPAWVAAVTVDTPATGGRDGQDDDAYLAVARGAAQLLSRSPILPPDLELAAQQHPQVARALVRDLYDDTTGLSNQERTASIYPVRITGLACDAQTKAALLADIVPRLVANTVIRVADPTYTTVNAAVTVAKTADADSADVAARVEAAVRAGPISPALFGQPALGETRAWKLRTKVRRYEVAVAADGVDGVDYVDLVQLSAGGAAVSNADVTLTGSAPLPLAGTVTITVIDAT